MKNIGIRPLASKDDQQPEMETDILLLYTEWLGVNAHNKYFIPSVETISWLRPLRFYVVGLSYFFSVVCRQC